MRCSSGYLRLTIGRRLVIGAAILLAPASWAQGPKLAGSAAPAVQGRMSPSFAGARAGSPVPQPPGIITDTGFASRLAGAVTAQGFPTIGLSPGVSGINHPGMAPSPSMQPLPVGTPFPGQNINSPGRPPVVHSPPHRGFDHRRRMDHRPGRDGARVVYYGVPYYVPYYVYTADSGASSSSSSSMAAASGYAAQPPAADASPADSGQSSANQFTLLAFKDGSVVIATDYWLEAGWLYYTVSSGQRLSAPLDRLDQPLTQQLNRERGVPFILEAR